MKTIFYCLLATVIVLTNIFSAIVVIENQAFDFLYERPCIEFTYNDDFSGFENFSNDLIAFSKEYNVNISQYVYYSDDKMYIYSTNIGVDQNIIIKEGNLPQKSEYLSSRNRTNKAIGQSGAIFYPNNSEIRIYNFEQVKNVGLDSTFFISEIDSEESKAFYKTFSKYGEISLTNQSIARTKMLLSIATKHKTLLMVILVVFAGFLSVLFLMMLQDRNAFIIAELWGHTLLSRGYSYVNNPLKYMAGVSVVCALGVLIYHVFWSSVNYLQTQMFALLVVTIFNCVMLFLMVALASSVVFKIINHPSKLKGKLPLHKIKWITVGFKLVITIFVISIILSGMESSKTLKQSLDDFQYWNQAKDIYRISVNFPSTQVNVWEFEREMNDRFLPFYKASQVSHGMFIMDSNNFFPYDSDKGNPIYSYTMNANGEEAIYSPYGRRITIDTNYLLENPIVLSDGRKVQSMIIQNENILNILVPEQYQIYEDQIKEAYLQFFYFQKVDVDNIYNEHLGLTLNTQPIEELKINILYTEKDQRYFTFNPSTGDSKNSIVDPIAIVFNESMDTSFLFAIMTSSTYFKDTSDGMAFQNIQGALTDCNIKEIKEVESVYSEVLGIIYKLKQLLLNEMIGLTIANVFSCLILYFLVISHFQLHAYKITLQYISGYSRFERTKDLLGIILLINICVGIPFVMSNGLDVMSTIVVILSVVDCSLVYISDVYLCMRNTTAVLKGDII